MKISITRTELTRALAIVSRGIAAHSTLPILSCIHVLTADDSKVIFETTDLDTSIQCSVTAFIEEPGSVAVPGKLLGTIAKSLPDAAVLMETNHAGQLEITCGGSTSLLNTPDATDFPSFPHLNPTQTVTLPVARIADMSDFVSRAISRDNHRVIMTGIYLSVHDNRLTLVSTDSYRLALCEATLQQPVEEPFEVILPGYFFRDTMKNEANNEEISLGVTENQILMSFADSTYVTRRIEGDYPNYERLIPKSHKMSAVVDTSELVAGIRRAAVLAPPNASVKFLFSVEKQAIVISSKSQDVGEATESISAEIEGEDIEIAFNYNYILDALVSMTTDKTIIELEADKRPGVIRPTSSDRMLYLVMSVHLG